MTELYKNRNLHVIFSVTLVGVMGVSIFGPALPIIRAELGVSERAIGMLITALAAPGVVLTPIMGILADRWGRKKVLVPSLLLYGAAGGACAFVRDFDLLLALRVLQGVGASALGVVNITLIGDLFLGRERDQAMGLVTAFQSATVTAMPIIGGALVAVAWYYPFLAQFLGLPVALGALIFLDNPEPKPTEGLGSYLKNAFSGMLNVKVISMFAVSTMTFTILYGSYVAYFPLHMTDRFGTGSILIGVIMGSGAAWVFVTSTQLGRLTAVFGRAGLIRISMGLIAASLCMVPFIHNQLLMFAPYALLGMGMGVNQPTINSLLADLAPLEQRAAFMSINGTVLRLGQTLGPVVMAGVFTLGGMEWVFFGGAILAVFMLVVAVVNIK